jgi:hypothetical protein
VLQRTELVLIEMIEVGVPGVWNRRTAMDVAGFDLYVVHATREGPRGDVQDPSGCDGDLGLQSTESWTASDFAAYRGATLLEYNALGLRAIQLEPICRECAKGCREWDLASKCRQFVFVRRGTATATRVHKRFGSCPTG